MYFFALSIQICPPHQFFASLTSGSSIHGGIGSNRFCVNGPVTIEVVPPICRSKLLTPALSSSTILLILLAPRATLSSRSIPGYFFLNPVSNSFRSSALVGTETTTLPSRLAASTVLSHSDCPPGLTVWPTEVAGATSAIVLQKTAATNTL